MVTFVRVMVPSCVAITAWPPSALAVMVTSARVTEDAVPMANAPFAPVPAVVIVPPVTFTVPPAVASKAALRP
jgi:hypothetical protein